MSAALRRTLCASERDNGRAIGGADLSRSTIAGGAINKEVQQVKGTKETPHHAHPDEL
ncbi:hypothetical protein QFC22_002911 [Naganishia vaughanmartiniae]|uniref:Uncharacterized protein n=1 Tax=Naganishia vaughanmartiniae TaxID=1424756 RepID=A0ACC2X9G9_9TREE|nr:hypothetical protein QFC22_002911 [Naganishia vaughanmartiniae]